MTFVQVAHQVTVLASLKKMPNQDSPAKIPGRFYAMLKLLGLRIFFTTASFTIVSAVGVGLFAPSNSTVTTKNLVCCAFAFSGVLAGVLFALIETRSYQRVVLRIDKKLVQRTRRSRQYYLTTRLGLSWVTKLVYDSVTEDESFEFGTTKRPLLFRVAYWGDVDLWGPVFKVTSNSTNPEQGDGDEGLNGLPKSG